MKHKHALIAVAVALTGCTSAEGKLCRAQFSETLLNPETAKFSDFKQIDAQELDGDPLYAGLKRLTGRIVSPANATYYGMKVKAQGELGNEITKRQLCAVNAAKDTCFCVPAS